MDLPALSPFVEVIGAKVVVEGSTVQHVIGSRQDRGGESADRLPGTAPGAQAMKLGLEIAGLCQTGFQYTPVASITMCVQPSTDSHSDKAIGPLVVVLNDRTSLFTSPSTMWRTQATTESAAFARAGSYERLTQRNVDAELPSSLIDIAGVGFPLKKSRTRAPGLSSAHGTIWGAQGSRVRLIDGLARTKKTPTSVLAALQPIPDSQPFHILRVGNFGGGLT
jgi:hypothetical protein